MKVHPFTIPKQPGHNIIVQVDRESRFYDRLHQHREIQLSYVVSGHGRLIVGNHVTTYGPNDFIGIGANLPHLFQSAESPEESQMISLFFLKDCFGGHLFSSREMMALQPIFEMLPFGTKMTAPQEIEKLFVTVMRQNEFEVFLSLLHILKHLVSAEMEVLNEQGFTRKLSTNQGRRLQETINFTLKNFNQPIALEKVAEKAHMGKNSFCRFFKQRTNKTFFQFLSEVRIHHACTLLTDKQDMPVAEIALESGYQSISNFNRQFKEIRGVSPKVYRKSSLTNF